MAEDIKIELPERMVSFIAQRLIGYVPTVRYDPDQLVMANEALRKTLDDMKTMGESINKYLKLEER